MVSIRRGIKVEFARKLFFFDSDTEFLQKHEDIFSILQRKREHHHILAR